MSKFTSIKSWPEYSSFYAPLLSKLGECGQVLYIFLKTCFIKYYEMRTEPFTRYCPLIKGLRRLDLTEPAKITLSRMFRGDPSLTGEEIEETLKAKKGET